MSSRRSNRKRKPTQRHGSDDSSNRVQTSKAQRTVVPPRAKPAAAQPPVQVATTQVTQPLPTSSSTPVLVTNSNTASMSSPIVLNAATPHDQQQQLNNLGSINQSIPNTALNIVTHDMDNGVISHCKAADDLGIHVSQANKDKIIQGGYIDLALLLQNNNTHILQPNKQTINLVQGELVVQPKTYQKITSIEQWTDAFITFISIYCQVHTDKFQQLLKYMNNVRIGAKRCGQHCLGWKQYDEQFRLKMAQHQTGSWAEIDLELWLLFISQPQSTTPALSVKFYAFNYNGVCNRDNCNYGHYCLRCNGLHPLITCQRGPINTGVGSNSYRFNRPRWQNRFEPPVNRFRAPFRPRNPGSVMGQRPYTY